MRSSGNCGDGIARSVHEPRRVKHGWRTAAPSPESDDQAAAAKRLRSTATLGLMRSAGRALNAPNGSVEEWDHRTSANDWRTALSLALGAPVDAIDPARGNSTYGAGVKAAQPHDASRPRSAEANDADSKRPVALLGGCPAPAPSDSLGARAADDASRPAGERVEGLNPAARPFLPLSPSPVADVRGTQPDGLAAVQSPPIERSSK